MTVTGRAAIIHEDALDEARDMAIEDALYYAVLKGEQKSTVSHQLMHKQI